MTHPLNNFFHSRYYPLVHNKNQPKSGDFTVFVIESIQTEATTIQTYGNIIHHNQRREEIFCTMISTMNDQYIRINKKYLFAHKSYSSYVLVESSFTKTKQAHHANSDNCLINKLIYQ